MHARMHARRARLFPRRLRPLSQAPSSSTPRARSRTSRRRFFLLLLLLLLQHYCLLCHFRDWIPGMVQTYLWTRPFPRRFFLPPRACKLRYCTTVAFVAAAVAAFLRRVLSLGLNPKDGSRALATAGSRLSRAYFCWCCCCCSCMPPSTISGIQFRGYAGVLLLAWRLVSDSFPFIITLLIIYSLFPFLLQ